MKWFPIRRLFWWCNAVLFCSFFLFLCMQVLGREIYKDLSVLVVSLPQRWKSLCCCFCWFCRLCCSPPPLLPLMQPLCRRIIRKHRMIHHRHTDFFYLQSFNSRITGERHIFLCILVIIFFILIRKMETKDWNSNIRSEAAAFGDLEDTAPL